MDKNSKGKVSRDNLPRDEDGEIIPFEEWSRDMDNTFGRIGPTRAEVSEWLIVAAIVLIGALATWIVLQVHIRAAAPHVRQIREDMRNVRTD